jgi:hypothetical protein
MGSLTEVWVQIKGIPPKWVDWHTVREVASGIGLMVEVDWHTLFNSFFNMVRVKVQCKNPTKVPRKRIFVFKGSLYLIRFKTEEFVQIENPSDDDKDPDARVEELENDDDDLLDDNPKDTPKENGENSKNGEETGPKRGKEVLTTKVDQGGKSAKSAKRALLFEDDDPKEAQECVDLLQTMELEGEESEDEEMTLKINETFQDDNEQVSLPDEWIFDLQQKKSCEVVEVEEEVGLFPVNGQNGGSDISTGTMVIDLTENNVDNFSSSFPDMVKSTNQKPLKNQEVPKKAEKEKKVGSDHPNKKK